MTAEAVDVELVADRRVLASTRRRELAGTTLRVVFLVFIGAVLYGPLLILVVFSFNDSIIIALPLEGFTTKWYQQVFSDPLVIEALKNSIIIALVVTPVCIVLGTLAAVGISRFRYILRAPVAGLVGCAARRAVAVDRRRRVAVLQPAARARCRCRRSG